MKKLLFVCISVFCATLMYENNNARAGDVSRDEVAESKVLCEMGHINSCVFLSKMYESGINEDEELAFYWVKKAADLGYTKGAVVVGNYYRYGIGVKKNPVEGAKYLIKAALKNNADAMYYLSGMFYRGEGVRQDSDLAQELLIDAAKAGHPRAISILGRF